MANDLDPQGTHAELQEILDSAYHQAREDRGGAVADYIPELATADPEGFGLAIATAGGDLYTVGDADVKFTMQSVSKALAYCLATELIGREAVMRKVGVEPSGDAFNAIEFDPHTRRPFNPMVNAGAITVAGILHDQLGAGAFDFILDRLSRAAGRPLDMDEAVYRSESHTGHRNRAISHLLLGAGVLSAPVEPIVDLYFRQCAIRVTAVDLAWIGATLANMGENPVTDTPVFDLKAVRDTQSVMFSCGMYDYSGNWAYHVGIPAKSGVGGGLVGVVNRQLGLGSYSPRLDAKGNSVRGVAAFATLSDELGLHAFDCTNMGSTVVERFLR
ncbi:glutaminase A [Iodidimonas sp. SYSU 1G8]|uniref:glutaminase A n=1 Tax=Iodidimonas sp. SYSU 1G8 TaxID=3133967 RepID=UPI0031FE9E33